MNRLFYLAFILFFTLLTSHAQASSQEDEDSRHKVFYMFPLEEDLEDSESTKHESESSSEDDVTGRSGIDATANLTNLYVTGLPESAYLVGNQDFEGDTEAAEDSQ